MRTERGKKLKIAEINNMNGRNGTDKNRNITNEDVNNRKRKEV